MKPLRVVIRALMRLHLVSLTLLLALLGAGCSKTRYDGGETFLSPREINAAHQGKTVLVHMKSGLKPDDSQPCVAFNMAAGLVRSGYKVSILIDARANADFLANEPAESKWGKYKLPESEKQALAAELNVPADQMPSTYLDYLKWIAAQGASIYMNSTMNLLNGTATKLQTQPKVPSFIKLLTMPEMAKLVAESEKYIAY